LCACATSKLKFELYTPVTDVELLPH